jgi:glycosyltransferase involved in cell wall biosynthesis
VTRLAAYADFAYRRDAAGALHAEESFSLFLSALADHLDAVTLVGRLDPVPGTWNHPVRGDVGFVALPHYESLASPASALRGMAGALRRWWRVLDDADAVWVLGPHPLGVLFALLAAARGRRVVLGVRQDLPAYVRNRRPGRRELLAAALLLEGAWRALGLVFGVVAVGPDLARRYRFGRRVLDASISLVPQARLEAPGARPPDGRPRVLSVGRLDPEKNPLLLADVLAALGDAELEVCGEGSLREALEARLRELGVDDRARLRGYVPVDDGLLDAYRQAHVLLHVSWTEGFPQVLVEAFAAGLPVVATDVGGVRELAGDAALLVAPGDAQGAAAAVRQVLGDAALRERLVAAGRVLARAHTMEAASGRVADFIRGRAGSAPR